MAVRYDPRTAPLIGPWLSNVGGLVSIVSIPCTAEWSIWVKALNAAAPRLAWSLLKPDPMDLSLMRGGRRHHKRRRARWTNVNWENPGGSNPLNNVYWWRIAGLAQRVGWYFLVADSTTEFLVNWTSMVYEQAGCITGIGSWAAGETPDPYWITVLDDWAPLNFLADPNGSPWIVANAIIPPPGTKANIAVNLFVNGPTPAGPQTRPTVDIRLYERGTGAILFEQMGNRQDDITAKIIPNVYEYVPFHPGATGVEVWVRTNNAYADVTGSNCAVSIGTLSQMGIAPDP